MSARTPSLAIMSNLEIVESIINRLDSNCTESKLSALTDIKCTLLSSKSPFLKQLVRASTIPRVVGCLGCRESPPILFEATQVLKDIAIVACTHRRLATGKGVRPIVTELLSRSPTDVRAQAIWAFGNIAGSSIEARDMLLDFGVLLGMLKIIFTPECMSSIESKDLKTATWTMQNLCKGSPSPPLTVILKVLPVMSVFLQVIQDEAILVHVCKIFSDISGHGHEQAALELLRAGICPRILEMLWKTDKQVRMAALQTIGNFILSSDLCAQLVLNAGALIELHDLMQDNDLDIRTEAFWILSNIAAGTPAQAKRVVDEPGVLELLISSIGFDHDSSIEAAWAVANLLAIRDHITTVLLLSLGCMHKIAHLLGADESDERTLEMALEAIVDVLESTSGFLKDDIIEKLCIPSVIGNLTKLEDHESPKISFEASRISKEFLFPSTCYPPTSR